MGWAFCGTDNAGRKIGYGVPATCDHPECDTEIDRGLAYCCGGMHGGAGYYDDDLEIWIGCGRYFCAEHRRGSAQLCTECTTEYEQLRDELQQEDL